MLEFDNPFADYGSIVRGERFIGRQQDLAVIESRIIRPREPGNLAIIGEPRIGKSSLIYKAIMERREELNGRRVLPIWINLATYDQSTAFFRGLVIECLAELEDLGWVSEPIQREARRALEDTLSWSEGYGRIQRFFEKVKRNNIQILFILDEFDHARQLFRGDISGFQGLRELSYRPEWRVNYITTSRRTIREIELQTQAISTFDGIFHKHYLAMFTESDLQAYFSRLEQVGLAISADLQNKINFYCGGHPYLLEVLGYELVENYRYSNHIDIERVAQQISPSFLNQYDRMVDLLREDKTLHKLLQILFGPVVDIKQTDVDELLRYGFIQLATDGTYVAFSEHFQQFLTLVERETDLWTKWRDTEIALRQLITAKMIETHGDEWPSKLEKARPKLQPMLDQCRQAQQKELRTFGSRASRNLIDFTYPADLFAIIFAEWNSFKDVLGKDKPYWQQRSEMLTKIRNPMAHNRDTMLYDYERKIAEGYCGEILRVIKGENAL